MKVMVQEKNTDLVLKKIKKWSSSYLINGDHKLTEEVAKKIRNMNWRELQAVNTAERSILDFFHVNDNNIDMGYIQEMRNNAQITAMNQPGVRFYFIKRVINRILKMTNRYQEIFNFAALRNADMMAQRIRQLEQNQNILYHQCIVLMKQIEQMKQVKQSKEDGLEP